MLPNTVSPSVYKSRQAREHNTACAHAFETENKKIISQSSE